MLVGIVGASFLAVRIAQAGDSIFVPNTAVDGVNSKVEAFGGSLDHRTLYGSEGSLSIPFASKWGVQIDGALGSWDNRSVAKIGGHMFWRDPSLGLLGVYGGYTRWNNFGGVDVGQVAGEGEYYWNRWSVRVVAGVEFGNSFSTTVITAPTAAGGIFTNPGTNALTSFDIKTRFFDQINLKYYFTDNIAGYVGHRYAGGLNYLALGGEAALPVGGGRMVSAFVEGRVGERDSNGVWGGLKAYFGQKDKSLMARHRQDDPDTVDSLLTIAGALKGGNTTTTQFCPAGKTIDSGSGLC